MQITEHGRFRVQQDSFKRAVLKIALEVWKKHGAERALRAVVVFIAMGLSADENHRGEASEEDFQAFINANLELIRHIHEDANEWYEKGGYQLWAESERGLIESMWIKSDVR
jgi:hypothetical protein